MSFYNQFPIKTYEEVRKILNNNGHENILNHLLETDEGYTLLEPIERISPLPTYQFAIACTLASLGNPVLANQTYSYGDAVIEPSLGDNISRELFNDFMS